MNRSLTNIEVFLGGNPSLGDRMIEGLIEFGYSHPQWRFALRAKDFTYSSDWLKKHNITGGLALIKAPQMTDVFTKAGIPLIHLLPAKPDLDKHFSVMMDNYAIGRLGAEKFIELGFTRFAFCGISTDWCELRARGFEDRLQASGHSCEQLSVTFDKEKDDQWSLIPKADVRLGKWLAQLEKRTGILVSHDPVASRLIDVCIEKGINVPDDVSILSVDNHELWCELSPIPISSIDCDLPAVATHAALLLEALINKATISPLTKVPPKGIVERRSTDILAFEDVLVRRIVEYIRDHACDGLTVNELLSTFRISPRTLSRRFEKSVGHTTGAEIRIARLRHAQHMLKESDLSLTEIAMACGFSDLSHMDRSFRSILNITPRSVRERRTNAD